MKKLLTMVAFLIIILTLSSCSGKARSSSAASLKLERKTDSEKHRFEKWNGRWRLGNPDAEGLSAEMAIANVDRSKFNFSIDAIFLSSIINQYGKTIPNPHFGYIVGTAYFTSSNKAYFSLESEKDYRMLFKLTSDNKIVIEEINVRTGQDYGRSPEAGFNVRYSGTYIKQ